MDGFSHHFPKSSWHLSLQLVRLALPPKALLAVRQPSLAVCHALPGSVKKFSVPLEWKNGVGRCK